MILVLELHATDQYCCMCCHGLKDADNHKPCMKPTTLRGTIEIRRTARWCQCTTPHQILQGCNRSGKLRTAEAQKYTLLFCKRLAADIFEALKPSSQKLKDFPASAEGEEPVLEDPYTTAEEAKTLDQAEEELRTIRATPNPPPRSILNDL